MPDQPPRKGMRRREISGDIRFITFSCQRRLPLLSNIKICGLFLDALLHARARSHVEVFAFGMMPEHVHLLCRPREGITLEGVLRSIKMSVAKRVLARWQELKSPILAKVADATGRPRFWQKGGGFDRNVRDHEEFSREVRYIHRNPVERALVANPEDWPWSSVRWWMGARTGEFEFDPPPGGPAAWEGWEGWEGWKGYK